MKEKKSNKVVRVLIGTVGFVAALVLTFFISYFTVSKLYTNYLDKKSESDRAEETTETSVEETVENCGFTMVYVDDPETEKVDNCVLRVFNELTCEMSVFQIPTDSQVTLSDEVYDSLSHEAEYDLPQTLFLSDIGIYFYDKETKYEMINLVMQDYLGGIEIRSYEAMDYETFVQIIDLAQPVVVKVSQIMTYTDAEGITQQMVPNNEYLADGRMALGILTYNDGFGNGDSGRIDRTASYLLDYVTSVTSIFSEEQMGEYLSSYYELVLSTGSTDSEEEYIKTCLSLTEENLSFYTLKGTQTSEAYVLNEEKIQEDMKILMGEEGFALATGQEISDEDDSSATGDDSADDSTEDNSEGSSTGDDSTEDNSEDNSTGDDSGEDDEAVISSKDLAISVFNGAYINGLAGRWNEKLQADGYYVAHVDNYTDATLSNGRIIVREEGMGKDLQEKYFPNATIEVGVPEHDDVDIQIILGKSEDF